ncbi:MAG: ABC transporter substrate-binding protein [Ignavibacteria bacterium]|jgi:microcin C transport system substrate-binding protein|nr:ABC transporter substrate-binding protein [Ignavibacteria bacterium]
MRIKSILFPVLAITLSALLISCGGKDSKDTKNKVTNTQPISIKQFDTPPGADPSVSAELGGTGFSGEGWTTSTDYNYIGDPKAVKGGSITWSIPDFPATLRLYGKDENSYYTRVMQRMVYESLLNQDPVSEDWTPRLASHWQISEDKKTFRFRINPDARWADGKPVTSEDVLATWKLVTDPGLLTGGDEIYKSYLQAPVAESKYIVSYKSNKEGWIPFNMAAGFNILPAHYIGNISASEYLEKYNYDVVPGSGPYYVKKEDVEKGRSIIVRRRSDYWAEKERFSTGLNNFDIFKTEVVSDESLDFEKFKKGDIDVYQVNRAQWWAERTDFEEVKNGTIVKKRIYNQNPGGLSGMALNMRKPPFDDIKIRKAFQMLYDVNKYNEKLFYNSYTPLNTQFAGTVYSNPNNPSMTFNLDSAILLIEEAGWKDKNAEGYRTKGGKVFEVEMVYTQPSQERYLTIFQEDLKRAGVKMNLKQVDGTTQFKIGNERSFSIIPVNWGGQNPPSLDFGYISKTAEDPNSTNWPGYKSAKVDELAAAYNLEYDKSKRVEMVRQIDSIITAMQPYVYGWTAGYTRLLWHNKFGYPKWYLSRFDVYYGSGDWGIFTMWWLDPEKNAAYTEAIKNKTKLPVEEVDSKFWMEVSERENKGEVIKLNDN